MSGKVSNDNIIKYRFKDLSMRIEDEIIKFKLSKSTEKNISTSLNRGMIDFRGQLWISNDGIIHLLRKNSKEQGQYEVEKIKKKHKIIIKNELYLAHFLLF